MFAGEEYRTYRDLCRQLNLERDLEEGDCYVGVDWHMEDRPEVFAGNLRSKLWAGGLGATVIWLPRFDQWVAMLREEGVLTVEVELRPEPPCHMVRAWHPSWLGEAAGPTDEEAAARCWQAVIQPGAR